MAAYTPADLAVHLQREVDTTTAVLALKLAGDLVAAYTRGQGFTAGVPGDDLAAVALLTAARLYGNPEHLANLRVGEVERRYGVFNGWTLPELAVLNAHRRRAA